MRRDIQRATERAGELPPTIQPDHVRIHVCSALAAPHRAICAGIDDLYTPSHQLRKAAYKASSLCSLWLMSSSNWCRSLCLAMYHATCNIQLIMQQYLPQSLLLLHDALTAVSCQGEHDLDGVVLRIRQG